MPPGRHAHLFKKVGGQVVTESGGGGHKSLVNRGVLALECQSSTRPTPTWFIQLLLIRIGETKTRTLFRVEIPYQYS